MSDLFDVLHFAGPTAPVATSSATGNRGKSALTASLPGFLLGPENRLLKHGVEAVLDRPGPEYNPLVLHGPSGLGKSHLALGIAQSWMAEKKSTENLVVSIGGADFARQIGLAESVAAQRELRAKFRSASLFVLDDLHSLASRPAAMQELWLTLDALADRQAQVVVTSLHAPQQLLKLPPGLVARLTTGLCVPIALPSPETRKALLQHFAKERNWQLAESAVKALADGLAGTPPELLGALSELMLHEQTEGTTLNVARVRQYLSTRNAATRPTLRGIATLTAKYYGLKVADLRSPSRRRAVVAARGIAIYLARQLTGLSLEQVGAHFGGRDHTTVLHSYRSTEERVRGDADVRKAFQDLKKMVAVM